MRKSLLVLDYPTSALGIPESIFKLWGPVHGVGMGAKSVHVGDASDSGYSLVWPLRGLRPDGYAGLELIHKRLGNTQRATVGLYFNCEDDGQVLGNIRLIQADCDTALRSGETKLRQQVIIDPLQSGVRLLGYPRGLLELAHMMEISAMSLAVNLPEYFDPPATTQAA